MNQEVFDYIFNLIETDPDYNLRFDLIICFLFVTTLQILDGKLFNIYVDIHLFDKIKHVL